MRLPVLSSLRTITACTALAGIVFTVDRPAAADKARDKVACAGAYERSQRLRQAGKLRASHEELLACSRPDCPEVLRQDCITWLAEVEAATPSVVFSARRANGQEETDVRVLVDGIVVAEQLTGLPVPIDPGDHRVLFEAAEAAPVEQRLTVREGERGRLVVANLPPLTRISAPPPTPVVAPQPPPPVEAPARLERPVPTAFYVLGVTGVLSAIVGTYFEASGLTMRSNLTICAPDCSSSEVNSANSARTTLWVGNIALGVSILALAGAVVVYLTRGERVAVPRALAGEF